jgi:uncharacterized protein YcaQ
LGPYDLAHLDTLLWEEKKLFEYWAHAASIVLTEDYPIHRHMMDSYPSGRSAWSRRIGEWVAANDEFRQHILQRMRDEGPLTSKVIEDLTAVPWESGGWSTNQNVRMIFDHLWSQGHIMVSGRPGRTRQWDLAERHLPDWTPQHKLTEAELVREAAQKSLRALGVARLREIKEHFTRYRYPDLETRLAELVEAGRIVEAEIVDGDQAWPGPWYIHIDDLPVLDQLAAGDWQPRTTLLSPFDNLICDRQRTEDLFNFYFRIEIYVPKAKRQYGYYVLPILHGDQLIGRLDPKFDKKTKRLTINALYAEAEAPTGAEVGQAIGRSLAELAEFIGAKTVDLPANLPAGWGAGLWAELT